SCPTRTISMHKASGWMLREAGKKDTGALRRFLAKHHTALPRTALRYAIEKMDKDERKRWMAK
ncbi:MAG: DNA alkylation repair protein, partial [Planctomycetes bacterium]|nr:DNA alkylation repair protein [Planctomycetota bacterium]